MSREKKRRFFSFLLISILLISSLLYSSHFISSHLSSSVFPIACLDQDALKKLPAGRVREAVAYVAGKHRTSVVLSKSLVISGIPEITEEVQKTVQSNAKISLSHGDSPHAGTVPCAPIGFVDRPALLKSSLVNEARNQYSQVFSNLKLEFNKRAEHLSPAAKENLKAEYNEALSAYQQKLLGPLLKNLEKTIKRVGAQKGLLCVVNHEDVLYGGVDVTWDVINPEKTPTTASLSAGNSIGVADPKKLIPLHPFFNRLEELDREEQAWKEGHYGIAETLLSPADVSRWENDRKLAVEAWEKAVREFTASSNVRPTNGGQIKQESGETEKQMAAISAAMKKAYEQKLQEKMGELNRTFQKHVGTAQAQTESALKGFADKLQQFRNDKIVAYRQELSLDFEKRVKNHAAALQEEDLNFERELLSADQSKKLDLRLKLAVAAPAQKKGLEEELKRLETIEDSKKEAKQEELRRNLETYRDQELVAIAQTLKSEAASLDQDAIKKITKYKDELIKGSQEALQDEQVSLRAELSEYRGKALEDAKKSVAEKFGKRGAADALTSLAGQGNALLQARLEGDRLHIQAKLRQEEKEILAHSKTYQETARSIKQGNQKIVSDVIQGLELEKTELLKAIKEEISRQVKTVAKKRGVPAVLSEVSVNVRAVDLTPWVAKQLK